jgi:hypothetical protein
MMRSFSRFSRLGRHSTLVTASAFRIEVRPPSLRHAPESVWHRLMFWLMAPTQHDAAPPLNRLPLVRSEFLASVSDLSGTQADSLRARIESARSLRDLWHLRSEIFRVVGLALSQQQAEARLLKLNHHFPTRAARSQPLHH